MNIALVVVAVGLLAYLGARYYLEKSFNRDQIFYIFLSLAFFFGIVSLAVAIANKENFEYYISIASVFTLISIMYYEENSDR